MSRLPGASTAWVSPAVSTPRVRRYLGAIQASWWLIVFCVVLAGAGSVIYIRSAHKVYTAEAGLLITPLQSGDPTLLSLGLINASIDPTRDAQTAARLVTTTDIALVVRRLLGLRRSPASLLNAIKVQPAAQSNFVTIQASASSRDLARRLADAFAEVVVATRTNHLHAVVRQLLPQLRATLQGLPPGDPLATDLVQLELLSVAPDPTVQLASHAQTPTSPSSPRPFLSLAVAILGGAILGIGGAFALRAIDPRLRGEDALRERYRLPVLARIPSARRWRLRRRTVPPEDVYAAAREQFRALGAAIGTSQSGARAVDGQRLLVSGSSSEEGVTTTAINVARALAGAGLEVILVDANLAYPSIGPLLGVSPTHGLQDVIFGEVSLRDALVPVMPGVELLAPASTARRFARDMLAYEEVEELLATTARLVDWVIVDAPPVTLAGDVIPFAQLVDDVLIVVRLDHTKLQDLRRLTEAFVQYDVVPEGFVVVGTG